MPISCQFRDCKALLVTSLTHVSGAIASVQTFKPPGISICVFKKHFLLLPFQHLFKSMQVDSAKHIHNINRAVIPDQTLPAQFQLETAASLG